MHTLLIRLKKWSDMVWFCRKRAMSPARSLLLVCLFAALQQVSAEVLSVDEGSLYPALYRMQKRGWVTSKWGRSENNRKARFYSITAKGRAQLEKATETWAKFSEAVTRALAT